MVRDPSRQRHVRAIEGQRPLRPERDADQRVRGRRSTPPGPSGSRRRPAAPSPAGRRCPCHAAPQIVDDQLVDVGRRHVWHVGGRRVHDASPPLIEARHPQGIVRQHLAHDRGEAWQGRVEIAGDRQLAEQFERAIEIGPLSVQTAGSAFVNHQHCDCLPIPGDSGRARRGPQPPFGRVRAPNRVSAMPSSGFLRTTLSGHSERRGECGASRRFERLVRGDASMRFHPRAWLADQRPVPMASAPFHGRGHDGTLSFLRREDCRR